MIDSIPTMTVILDSFPANENDNKVVSVSYEDKQDPSKSFKAEGCVLSLRERVRQYDK